MGYATPAELMTAVNGGAPGSSASNHQPARRPLFTPAQIDAQFAALTQHGEIAGMELQLIRADGSPIWVELNARWQEEKGLVDKLLDLRGKLRAGNKPVDAPAGDAAAAASSAPDREGLLAELHALQQQISAVQGETPLILPSVDAQAVSSVVADGSVVVPSAAAASSAVPSLAVVPESCEESALSLLPPPSCWSSGTVSETGPPGTSSGATSLPPQPAMRAAATRRRAGADVRLRRMRDRKVSGGARPSGGRTSGSR